MSVISDAFKNDREVIPLVELDFGSWKQRFTTHQGGVLVPNSGGDDLFFDGKILNEINISSSVDLQSMRQSISEVTIEIANDERFQDNELRQRLEGGTGKIYLWSKSLDWTNISSYPVYFGSFVKLPFDKFKYRFKLVDPYKRSFERIPLVTINDDTWPDHRKTPIGVGSHSGYPVPMVFGHWPAVVPMYCINHDAPPPPEHDYLLGIGAVKSTDADFTAGTEVIYKSDGTAVGAGDITFHPVGIDYQGNISAWFEITIDLEDDEPLYTSIQGLMGGEVVDSPSDLIEHPAEIIHYLMLHYSKLAFTDISIETIKTMKSVLARYKFASIINQFADSSSIIDRILSQCSCMRIQRWGKMGVLVIDFNGPSIVRILEHDSLGKTETIEDTDYFLLCNNLKVFYGLNPTTKAWEGEFTRDRTNNIDCEESYREYGEQPQRELRLSDVQDERTAIACVNRFLKINAFKHSKAKRIVPYHIGFDILEGDVALLSFEEGQSLNGEGWDLERCILLSRTLKKNYIEQVWWKIDP